MNIRHCVLVGVISMAFLVAADEPSDQAAFCYTEADDSAAASALARSLRQIDKDWETATSSGTVTLKVLDRKVLIQPRMSLTLPDRLVLTMMYGGKGRGNAEAKDCLAFVNGLNSKQNYVQFSVDSDGDLLCQASVTFRNYLPARDLQQGVLQFVFVVDSALGEERDAYAKYFK